MFKVIIVDDDLKNLRKTKDYFEKNNLKVTTTSSGYEAIQFVKNENPYLVLLNIDLPDMHGFEVCKMIRRASTVPVLFLTENIDRSLVKRGFDLGADDFVLKPFDLDILIGRIKACIKRYYKEIKGNILKFDNLEIDQNSYTVYRNGQPVPLIAKELQILMHLAKNPNQVFSAEQLYQKIWGIESLGDARTVMVHISNLRKKIEEDPAHPTYIQTVRGFGYKLSEPIIKQII